MAQTINDRFHPVRDKKRIDAKSNTPVADGPKGPAIQGWRQRFGEAMDVLKMRIKANLNPGNGSAAYKAAKETANTQGLQNVRNLTKKSALRSGGYFLGALFNV